MWQTRISHIYEGELCNTLCGGPASEENESCEQL